MKKILCFALAITCSCITFAQKKHYISLEQGFTATQLGNQLNEYLVNNRFNATEDYSVYFFFYEFSGSKKYPVQHSKSGNYRIRYGYRLTEHAVLEGSIGSLFQTTITGSNGQNQQYNHLTINARLYSFQVNYMINTKKDNLGIGIGPAITICRINQQDGYNYSNLSGKTNLLPGANISAYWHFVNQKHWYMGIRTDMLITTKAKIEGVSITHHENAGFISRTSGSRIGAITNTLSLSAGIKIK